MANTTISDAYQKVIPINTGAQSSRQSSDTAAISSDPTGKAHMDDAKKKAEEAAAALAAQNAAAKAVTDQAAYDKALADSKALTAQYSAPAATAAPVIQPAAQPVVQPTVAATTTSATAPASSSVVPYSPYRAYTPYTADNIQSALRKNAATSSYNTLLTQYNQIMGTNYTAL